MTHIKQFDKENIVFFTEGSIPSVGDLTKAYCGTTPAHRNHKHLADIPQDAEEAKAWIMAARAQDLGKKKYGLNLDTHDTMEAWVIGPSNNLDTDLAGWFSGMPENYRLFIQRTPRIKDRPQLFGTWYRTGEAIPLTHRKMSAKNYMKSGNELAANLLEAYKSSSDSDIVHQACREVLDATGHPYAHSRGLMGKIERGRRFTA